MLTISLHKPEFLSFSHYGFRNFHKFSRTPSSWTMAMNSYSGSFETRKKEELSIQVPATSIYSSDTQRLADADLRFDRLQVPEKELMHERKVEFGQFVAREAVIDEEYWTAAWLRAESHWEGINDRYVDNHKRKFAEQEFHAIKRRRTSLHGQKCRCIIMVRKEDKHVKRTVLKGVVGTLDLSVRCLMHEETFPGERVKAPLFCSIQGIGPNRYGLCCQLVCC
ncbi:ACYL-COA N-ACYLTRANSFERASES (NAT) SUPERFAMILY PROTEIN [Salix purpurea]|uniref:ACYL-COA N-ACYLTRANSFERASES (NAT) SUPERFAMILY PROTEIN n=1 Tax=Salix purpurea TaxID=77065 RepID=A0A9Q0T2I5_SALPP|nr:ACYL-COA N-ACYLTRANSFERASES (NAT) SUPERFAMILY PROTEIN [Salix purpurea]KAJ6698990.1 ACYL-COA N-ACYLTRANSFERASES (NAT) SUPERFAMILY PROTEIN [Salix purpurea]